MEITKVNKFMEKITADPQLAKKLEQIRLTYVNQLIALAQGLGITITEEDFLIEATPITDDEADSITGGILPPCYGPLMIDGHFVSRFGRKEGK